jgi:ankyrin repeat protein
VIREDCGLPGGLHDQARPDAYDDSDEDIRALFTYRTGAPSSASGTDLVSVPPLVMAAQRGNVDAVHLLLLFGEGVHGRRKANERALVAAVEQGNPAVVAALLGRVPLRPPRHPPHVAKRLGLFRPVYRVYGPEYSYSSGVSQGPCPVPAAIAGAKIRAELASAQGISTSSGTRASAAAAAALTATGQGALAAASNSSLAGRPAGGGLGSVGMGMSVSTIEAALLQAESFEADGRYRGWCRGYHMGTFWATYDTALAAWEALHGTIGGEADMPVSSIASVAASAAAAAPPPAVRRFVPLRATAAGPSSSSSSSSKGGAHSPSATRQRITVSLPTLAARLALSIAPGSAPFGAVASSITAAYAAQALLVSRLPPNMLLPTAARVRPRGHIHPRLPPPVDYGTIAADALAIKVRLNVGPVEGRTPLHVAAEKGRTEIAYLLLSHHNPALALTGEVPELPPKLEDDGPPGQPGGGGGQGAAAAPGGQANAPAAPAAPGAAGAGAAGAAAAAAAGPGGAAAGAAGGAAGAAAAAPAPTVIPAAVLAARAALAAIAQQTAYALAVPVDILTAPLTARKEEVLGELLGERRDRADVDASPSGFHTPLCLACERGDDRLASLLLHWGADVNRPGKKEARPVLVAAMAGHEHILRLLLRTSCDIDSAKAVAGVIADIQARRDALGAAGPLGATGAGGKGGKRAKAGAAGRKRAASTSSGGSSSDSGSDDDDDDDDDDDAAGAARGRRAGGKTAGAASSSSSALVAATAAAGGNATDGVFNLLGLTEVTTAMREGGSSGATGGKKSKKTGNTAATAAMGSTIAVQSGRRKAKGDARRPEDAALDLCEPVVIAALAAAAAQTGGVDEWGNPTPPRPAPYDPAQLYLPPEEAAMSLSNSAPSYMSYFKFGGAGGSGAGGKKLAAGAGGGRLAALLASGVISSVASTAKAAAEKAARDAAAAAADADADAIAAEILSVPTAPSYTALVAALESYRTSLKAHVFTIINKSRIASGVGALTGRPTLFIDAGDESGYSALFIMACAGKLDSVQLLSAAGADPCLATKRGKTPIYGAVEKQHNDVVEFLMPKYTASQLRANTTYGTNVLHAANKSGNSRVRDMLQAYCIEYDNRMARQIKAEDAARRKAMWGDGAGGDPGQGGIAEGSEAANHLARLRRLADVARKKQEEKSWALLAKAGGGGGSNAGAGAPADEDDEGAEGEGDGAGVRGRAAERGSGDLSPYRSGSKQPRGRSQSKGPAGAAKQGTPKAAARAPSRGSSADESEGDGPPAVARGRASGSGAAAAAAARSSRPRSSSSAPSDSDTGASEAENAGATAGARKPGERQVGGRKEGGLLLSRLAAAAAASAYAARESDKAKKDALIAGIVPGKAIGSIPASVYAAAAASVANGSPRAGGSGGASGSAANGGAGGASSSSGPALSPYARRMDGTISPAAAALLTKSPASKGSPLASGRVDTAGDLPSTAEGDGTRGLSAGGARFSPLGSGSGDALTATSSPLSTQNVATGGGSSSSFSSKGGAGISPRTMATTLVSAMAAVADVGPGGGANNSVFDRLAQRAKELDAKKKALEEESKKRPTLQVSAQAMAAAFAGLPPKAAAAGAAGGSRGSSAAPPTTGRSPRADSDAEDTAAAPERRGGAGSGARAGGRTTGAAGGGKAAAGAKGAAASARRGSEAGSTGGASTRDHSPSAGGLDTSMEHPAGKYGSNGAELRASARAQLVDGVGGGVGGGLAVSGTASQFNLLAAAAASGGPARRDVSPMRSPARNRHDLALDADEGSTSAAAAGGAVGPVARLRAARKDGGWAAPAEETGSDAASLASGGDDLDTLLAGIDARAQALGRGSGGASGASVARASSQSAGPSRTLSPLRDQANKGYDGSAPGTRSPGALSEPGGRRAAMSTNDLYASAAGGSGGPGQENDGRPPLRPRPGFVDGGSDGGAHPADLGDPDSPFARVLGGAGISPRGRSGAAAGGKKAALLGAALGAAPIPSAYQALVSKGMVPTASGSTFVAMRQSMSLGKASFDGIGLPDASGGAGGGGGGNGNGGNGVPRQLSRDEVQAREDRNRQRDMAKLERVQRAREELEARAREMEMEAAAAHAAAATASSLKMAAAAYGAALPTKKKKSKA